MNDLEWMKLYKEARANAERINELLDEIHEMAAEIEGHDGDVQLEKAA